MQGAVRVAASVGARVRRVPAMSCGLAPGLRCFAQPATLDPGVDFATLAGRPCAGRAGPSPGPVDEPLSFAIDNPARVALDFRDVTLNLPRRTERSASAWRAASPRSRRAGAPAWC